MQAIEIGRFKLVSVVRAHVSPEDASVDCVRVLGGSHWFFPFERWLYFDFWRNIDGKCILDLRNALG